MTLPTPTRRGTRARLAAVALAAVGLCALAPVGAVAAPQAPNASATSWVRVAHLVPDLGTMTIGIVPLAGDASGDVAPDDVPEASEADGARVLAPAAGYGTVGDYRQVPAGRYVVTVRPKGAPASDPPILTGTFRATADRAFTLAALGTATSPRVDAFDDSLRPPPTGRANVRLLPAVPDASAMTVRAVGGPVLAEDAAYGSPTDYAAVPPGRWTLDVTLTGTASDAIPGRATVDVASGGVYTVFVLADGATVRLTPVVDALGVGSAPQSGVQTGGGGLAVRPVDPRLVGGLLLAGAGLLALLATRRRLALAPGRR